MSTQYFIYNGPGPSRVSPDRLLHAGLIMLLAGWVLLQLHFGIITRSVQGTYTDTTLHSSVSENIAYTASKLTGSKLLGEWTARSIGYAKEALDVSVGKAWSQEDLAANETGIYQAL